MARSLYSLEKKHKTKKFKPVFLDIGKKFQKGGLNHDFQGFNMIYHSTQSDDYLW